MSALACAICACKFCLQKSQLRLIVRDLRLIALVLGLERLCFGGHRAADRIRDAVQSIVGELQ